MKCVLTTGRYVLKVSRYREEMKTKGYTRLLCGVACRKQIGNFMEVWFIAHLQAMLSICDGQRVWQIVVAFECAIGVLREE